MSSSALSTIRAASSCASLSNARGKGKPPREKRARSWNGKNPPKTPPRRSQLFTLGRWRLRFRKSRRKRCSLLTFEKDAAGRSPSLSSSSSPTMSSTMSSRHQRSDSRDAVFSGRQASSLSASLLASSPSAAPLRGSGRVVLSHHRDRGVLGEGEGVCGPSRRLEHARRLTSLLSLTIVICSPLPWTRRNRGANRLGGGCRVRAPHAEKMRHSSVGGVQRLRRSKFHPRASRCRAKRRRRDETRARAAARASRWNP